MGKRQTVNTFILAIIILGSVILVFFPSIWVAFIFILVALLVGIFRRQIYKIL